MRTPAVPALSVLPSTRNYLHMPRAQATCITKAMALSGRSRQAVRAVFRNVHDLYKKKMEALSDESFFYFVMGWFGICIENKKYSMDQAYRECIDACQQCASACDQCASACL